MRNVLAVVEKSSKLAAAGRKVLGYSYNCKVEAGGASCVDPHFKGQGSTNVICRPRIIEN